MSVTVAEGVIPAVVSSTGNTVLLFVAVDVHIELERGSFSMKCGKRYYTTILPKQATRAISLAARMPCV